MKLTAQQRAVLLALIESRHPMPTTILRDVRVRYEDAFPRATWQHGTTFRIGGPVGSVLRRLEKRGLVTGEMGSGCKEWRITDLGLEAMGWSRGLKGEPA